METEFSLEKAKQLLEEGAQQAQELLNDPSGISGLLAQVEEKISSIPVIGTDLVNVPVMISMIRSYITKEYSAVSPKVIAAVVSALAYFVKKKDLIPDYIPVLGQLDDVAVIGVAMKICAPELAAYAEWKSGQTAA